MNTKRSAGCGGLTASEMGKRGAAARKARLSPERIREIALLGGAATKAKAQKRKEGKL